MQRAWPVALLASGWIAIAARAEPQHAPHPPDTGKGAWLVERLVDIADAGVLFEPARVAAILGLTFEERPPTDVPKPVECKPPARTVIEFGSPLPLGKAWYDAILGVTFYAPVGDTWYSNTPEGVAHPTVHDSAAHGPVVLGDPEIKYAIIPQGECSGRYIPKEYKVAELAFQNAPGFSCLTRQEIEAIVPAQGILRSPGSIDRGGILYTGKVDDAASTAVSFVFMPGTLCMVKALLTQNPLGGHRYLEAVAELYQCTEQADREFRKSHAPLDFKDPTQASLYQGYVGRQCGTLDEHFRGMWTGGRTK
jgi:hypothetical protein